jgi:tRNA U34 5-carboxymethylaminomethyl modifying GTPase MnmE/TrmE
MDDFTSILNDQLKQLEAIRNRGRVNLLVAGKTGVGKSTLINAVFQGNFASTGQGRPATRNTRKIKKKGVPLYIFDTRGLELDRFLESLEELEDLICGLAQSEDPNEYIHCAWLCISQDGRRIEDAEIKLLNLLAKHIPVVAVITKSRADNGFRSEVQRLCPEPAMSFESGQSRNSRMMGTSWRDHSALRATLPAKVRRSELPVRSACHFAFD